MVMEIKKIISKIAIAGFIFLQLMGLSGCQKHIKVVGEVIDSELQKGVKGVEVKIIPEGEEIPIDAVKTDELGKFTFQKLKLERGKRYKLVCEGPTFEKREKEIDPTQKESIIIVITLRYALEGRVTTFAGEPIPGARVSYLLGEDKRRIACRYTDESGRFFFHNMLYNKVRLRVECHDYIPCESENVITIKKGEKIELGNIQLERITTPTYTPEEYTSIKIEIKGSVIIGDL